MARDDQLPPEDFVAFVARRTLGLRRAAHSLSGNPRLAESLVDDLLIATAARWRRFAADAGAGPGGRASQRRAADAYLDRILAREAAQSGVTGRPGGPGVAGDALPPAAAAELATRYWQRGLRTRRRRRVTAVGIAVVVLLGLAFAPRAQGPVVNGEPPTVPVPTGLPPQLDVLPAFGDQTLLPRRETALPSEIGVDPAQAAGYLAAGTITRALAVFLPAGNGPMVLGEDGAMRRLDVGRVADVDVTSRRSIPPLTSASLAPDGTRIAFLGNDVVTVVELATAKATRFPALDATTAVAWLTPFTLLIAGPARSLVLDPRTGDTAPTAINAHNALTAHTRSQAAAPPPGAAPIPRTATPPPPTNAPPTRTATTPPPSRTATTPPPSRTATAGPGPARGTVEPPGTGLPARLTEHVVELLPIGEPATAPARIRRYFRVADDTASQVDTALSGEAIGWLGPWRGPGFLAGGATGSAVRDCDASALRLPERYSEPLTAAVVVEPATGHVRRSLVATAAGTNLLSSMVLGWLDAQTVLLRTSDGRGQNLLAWRVSDGELRLVSTVNRDAEMSVADLAAAGTR